MKYFEIKTYTPKGGGEFIKDYHHSGLVLSEKFLGSFAKYGRIDPQPVIPVVEIGKNYPVPDIIIPGGPISGRYIVSSPFRKVLDYNGADRLIQYFPIKLVHDGKLLTEFWITQYLSFDNSLIDFDKSVFIEKITSTESNGWIITKRISHTYDKTFESNEELTKRLDHLYERSNFLYGKKLVIRESCIEDVILLEDNLCSSIIVSENLKFKLQKLKFKGLLFKPLEWSEKQWYGPDSPLSQFYI